MEMTLSHETQGSVPLRSEADIVASRQMVRKLAVQLKFSLVDQTKMITAASELSRNTVVYGGGGDMEWELLACARGFACAFGTRGRVSPTWAWPSKMAGPRATAWGWDCRAASGWSMTSSWNQRWGLAPASA